MAKNERGSNVIRNGVLLVILVMIVNKFITSTYASYEEIEHNNEIYLNHHEVITKHMRIINKIFYYYIARFKEFLHLKKKSVILNQFMKIDQVGFVQDANLRSRIVMERFAI